MPAVVALNVMDVKPAGTVTEPGTVNTVFVFVSVTTAPPVGAAAVKVTVHVLDAFGPRLVGLQPIEETSTGTRLRLEVWVVLLSVAVTIAF